MKTKHIILALFIFIISISFTACKSDLPDQEENPIIDIEEPNEETNNEPIQPIFGGTIKLAIRNPITLNPLLNEEQSLDQLLKLVFEPLFKIDEKNKPVPNLVETYTVSPDQTSITLVLKKDLQFSNLDLLTAYDVQYSINTLKEAGENVIYKACIDNIQRTSVQDDYTIKIYFKQPYAFSTYYLNFPIVSKSSGDIPIGSGYYMIQDLTQMQALNLTASPIRKDEVYIEHVEAIITRDASVDNNSFQQNLIDLLMPSKFDWFDHSDRSDQRLFDYATNYYEFIGFNFENSILKDPAVRQAIAHGIDRVKIAENQFLSQVAITDLPIHPNSWLSPENNEISYSFDPKKSKDLLKEVELENVVLRLLVNKDNLSRSKISVMIQNNLKEIGINVEIISVDKDTYNAKLLAGEYDLVLSGWKLSIVPDFTDMFHSLKIAQGTNFIRYQNPEMDLLLNEIFLSNSDEVLYNNIQKFNELYKKELPYFSLYFLDSLVLANDNIKGDLAPVNDFSLNGIENIYIDPNMLK